MERTTDKHSPRVDEALEHDVQSLVRGHAEESRAQEQRLQEVEVGRLPHGDRSYDHLEAVWEALGGANDGTHTA